MSNANRCEAALWVAESKFCGIKNMPNGMLGEESFLERMDVPKEEAIRAETIILAMRDAFSPSTVALAVSLSADNESEFFTLKPQKELGSQFRPQREGVRGESI